MFLNICYQLPAVVISCWQLKNKSINLESWSLLYILLLSCKKFYFNFSITPFISCQKLMTYHLYVDKKIPCNLFLYQFYLAVSSCWQWMKRKINLNSLSTLRCWWKWVLHIEMLSEVNNKDQYTEPKLGI